MFPNPGTITTAVSVPAPAPGSSRLSRIHHHHQNSYFLHRPTLGLRTVNPDENEVEDFSEYMTIRQEDFHNLPDYPSTSWAAPGGNHELHVVNGSPAKPKKRFVGGFVTGLKRIPKAMFGAGGLKVKEVKRQRQKSTDAATHLTETIPPQYRTNPSTPIVAQMPRTHASLTDGSIPASPCDSRAPAAQEQSHFQAGPTYRGI
ncbi:hypothetical protein IW261DRAFT_27682 [Armillaria novae-zelandiae]|uniref:Uncharacterized protein n=1 Tax=Armillaria novae-zelandiae TaxID=153914 RepID=A0AA39PU80_9AGAR|nr:hypothetical protein IW261DRAFT_27682 [Armillaria novae-zelandiae]